MQKIFTKALLTLIILMGCGIAAEASMTPRKGVIRVKLQPEIAAQVGATPRMQTMGNVATGVSPFDAAAQKVKVASIRRVFPYSAKFEARHAEFGLDRWYEISFDESIAPEQASQIFSETPGVQIAHTIVPMQLVDGSSEFFRVSKSSIVPASTSTLPFNDPMLSAQWHYNNDGTIVGSVAGADAGIFDAWEATAGRSDVIVAIVDGGIDVNHEDLSANIEVNTAELNGVTGVDDDENGYVDDIYGYNFCTNSGAVYPHDHGTHVAGTVAAVNNNGIGVCGVAGGDGTSGSGIRMISCQVFDSRSGSGEGDYAAALVYAADRGASIAQCSWGWSSPDHYEQEVLDAIDYFTKYGGGDNLAGGLCIFATGNDGSTGNYYPACYEPAVAVSAMTCNLTPASYSNYGEWVDITAPGGDMSYSGYEGVLSTLPDNQYGYNEGTSMATPHVAGIAALVLSKYGKSTLSNESLRTQLLTSVNDFYTKNPSAAGLFGSGYIDAGKAMVMGDGSAPDAVDSFTATAGQDNILIEWVVPNCTDGAVNNHILYFSTEEFDATVDLSTLDRVNIDTKFLASGDATSYELTGLQPLTTYYLTLQAVSRWGDASAISPIVSVTTNAGPKMTVDVTSLTMKIDAATSLVGSAVFNIGNEDEGLLKWSGKIATKSYTPSKSSVSKTPVPGLPAQRGKIGITPYAANEVVTADYVVDDYPRSFNYHKEYWASIGDSDRSLPNSQAQWFYVDEAAYPDGFNLTNVEVSSNYGQNPTIQIYDGRSSIVASKLLQEIVPSYFYNGYQVPLTEQIHFAPGESFWVVAHFPAEGNQDNYPLGLANGDAAYSGYSYMSNDLGKTWMLLTEALKGSPYESMGEEVSWAITAISKNPAWNKVFTLDPSEGQVKYGETQAVTMKNDGQKLVNGTYKFNLSFTTNESDANAITIPVTATVSGNKPEMSPVKVINFGSLLVGETKSIDIELFNEGYGVFTGSYGYLQSYNGGYSSSSEHYTIDNVPMQGFPARATSTVTVTYTPQSAGDHTGTITFKNANGIEFKLTCQGVATEPAKIAIEPSLIDLWEINVDAEAFDTKFTIKNEGKYPLEYVFPKFSDRQLEASAGKTSHKYGYTALTNLNGASDFAYDGNPDLIGATDITATFSDDVKNTSAISLGFDFPFYGQTYDKVYINSLGGISFSLGEYSYFPPLRESSESLDGIGYISAYGHQLQFGPSSSVSYAKQDGKFVVNFSNVLAVKYDVEVTPISFRIMLSANGDIEIFYDDYVRTEVGYDDWGWETEIDRLFQGGSTLFCAIKDPEGADPLVVTSADVADYWNNNDDPQGDLYTYFNTESSVKFEAPAAYFVTGIEPAYSIVNPGESVEVTATIKGNDSMYAGATTNRLAIESNDPATPTSFVTFTATIAGANLLAAAALDNDDIDFGQVFRTSDAKLPVTIKNTGKDVITVNSVTIVNGKFTTDITTPFTIEAGLSKDVIVTLPTAKEGEVEDVMIVNLSAGDNLIAYLKGEVIGCPGVELSFTDITETVESGTELAKELVITNNGDEPLTYSVVGGNITSVADEVTEGASVSYIYSSATDNENTKFEWIDIETNGLGEQYNFSFYNRNDYTTVKLPFEFPFYGKKYTELYLYNTGFVSFTKRDDQKIWPEPPADFPGGTIYTNIIAPYWGLHTMSTDKTAGTYHYVTDEQAVISWMEYGNTMNIGVCYQLIMKKDGSFKFQYKSYGEYAIIYDAFGLAGMSNEDGSESLVIPDRLIQFNNAVQFTPVVEITLDPQESKTVDVTVDTDKMAGTYTDAITVNTNVPASEKIEIPVTLTVTGEAVPAFPTDITIEHVAGYTETMSETSGPGVSMMGAPYEAQFTIANTGTAPFTIANIAYSSPSDSYGSPMFQLLAQMMIPDWMTGQTSLQWTLYDYYAGMPIEVTPSQPFELTLPMSWEASETIGTYEIPLTFTYTVDGVNYLEKVVNVTFNVTDTPYAFINKEMEAVGEIRVENATPDYKGTETVNLANQGAYKLTYELKLDLTGEGEEVPESGGGGGIAPWMTPEIMETLKANFRSEIVTFENETATTNVYDVPSDFEYNKALYHASFADRGAMTYGTGNTYGQYKAATHYVAPEGGFNVSHVYIASTLTNMDGTSISNADYTVEIVAGNDYENGTVVGTGSYHVDEMEGARFMAIPLDKSVYLSEGQEFYVRVTYPVGVDFPAYMTYKEDGVESNRYMAYVEGYGWFDVASMFKDTYGSLGYIMTCIETVPGEPWVKLLNESATGEIAPGESVDLNFALSAASAPLEKGNKAMLVIKSNDSAQPVINFPIYLDLNGAPAIEVASGNILAAEGSETTAVINIRDLDGDDFTFTMTDNGEMTAIKGVAGDGATISTNEDGSYTVSGADAVSGADVTVAITPDYGTEGEYTLTFDATDANGNAAQKTVDYTVAHTNRAPVADELGIIQVVKGGTSSVIDFNDVFTDPDGDAMSFNLYVSSENIVTTFVSGTSVIFVGQELGTVNIQAVATDANGATTTTVFTVEVVESSGIDDITIAADIEVYPNPVVENLNVTCDFDAPAVNYAIYSLNGAKVIDVTEDAVRGVAKTINVGGLADGIYLLKVTADGSVATFPIVKN